MRRARWLVLALAFAMLASGCSKKHSDSENIVGFVDKTTPHAYRLKYDVTEGKVDVSVQGIIEDDFRYKLQMDVNKKTAAEQVVVDDAVAALVRHGRVLPAFAGAPPWALHDQHGQLLALYDAFRSGEAKPAVVLSGGPDG